MGEQQTEDLRWVLRDLAAQNRVHDHLLVKDTYICGWRCQVDGCRFFKPAEDFDAARWVGGGSRGV